MNKRILLSILAFVPLLLCAQTLNDIEERKKVGDSIINTYNLATRELKQGNISQAKAAFLQYLSYGDRFKWERQHPQRYHTALFAMAQISEQLGDIDTAIEYQQKGIDQMNSMERTYLVELVEPIHKMAYFKNLKNDYDGAIETETQLVELLRTCKNADNSLGVTLLNLAEMHYARARMEDFDKAISLAEEARKLIDKKTDAYVKVLSNLVGYHAQKGNYAKSEEFKKIILKNAEKVYGKKTVAYANVINNLAINFAYQGNLTMAIDYAEQAKSIYESDSNMVKTKDYGKVLKNLSSYYVKSENYDKGIDMLNQAKDIFAARGGTDDIDFVNCISELANAYHKKGDLEKATEAITSLSRMNGQSTNGLSGFALASVFSKQAETYAAVGDYDLAIECEEKAQGVLAQYDDKAGVAQSKNRLSNYLYHKGSIDEAIMFCNASLGMFAQLKPAPIAAYAEACNNMSIYQYESHDIDQALKYGIMAASLYEHSGDTKNTIYAKMLGNVALFYYAADSLKLAIKFGERSFETQQKILGELHPDNVVMLFNLANMYNKQGNVKKTREYYHKALTQQIRYVKNNFSHLTTVGRERYWHTKNYVFKSAPSFAYIHETDTTFAADAYNSLLFTKGILLNSEVDFNNLLRTTGDTLLLNKYATLTKLHKQIEDYSKTPDANQMAEVESLEQQATKLERELIRNCKEYGDFTSNLTVDYNAIIKGLKPEDVAIEFVSVREVGGRDALMAFVVRKGWETPKCVPLFSINHLNDSLYAGYSFKDALSHREGINALFTNPDVGEKVWRPLIDAWGDGVENVYFAPVGLLYQFGIEYLTLEDGISMSDQYNIYRLSSTKQIVQSHHKPEQTKAAVFGALNYSMTLDDMVESHNNTATHYNEMIVNDDDNLYALAQANSDAVRSLGDRGNLAFLEGTRREVNDIMSVMLQDYDIQAHEFTFNHGTEEAFKLLSGKQYSILHIATHGFYLSEDTDKDASQVRFIEQSEGFSSYNDRSMNLSGLLMAGANNAWNRGTLPNGIENGILTAKEVSLLDFRGLDLLVLSACQTGLGDIKEDGVFGLQRGFKKAGANTILMSLWKVDDDATQILMSAFYKAYLAGTPRRQALMQAQKAVRDRGYKDPYYWASFIMLDGI